MNIDLVKLREKTAFKRRMIDKLVAIISTFFAIIGLLILFWIILTLIIKGLSGFSFNLFITDTIDGGLRNAIIGHIILVSIACLIGIPIGLLAGTYLSEYGINKFWLNFIRNVSDIMMSMPSIVVGAFVYAIVVAPSGGYSGWAGSFALAIMMIPIILKTTDDMLSLVPKSLREAAFALGAPKFKVIKDIVFRVAKNGLLTGVILSIARVAGETAPLLFTSFHNDFLVFNPNDAMPSLTNSIYEFAQLSNDEQNLVAWSGALLLATLVLGINIIAKFIARNNKK